MAMDVGGAKGGVKSDINVTPLVDVKSTYTDGARRIASWSRRCSRRAST